MGLGIFKPSGCNCGGQTKTITKVIEKVVEIFLPNPIPNPKNFAIVKTEQYDTLLIVMINYPDCKNYEGNKILVFENIMESQLRAISFIDPHFCAGSSHLSPIARFEPTKRGWQMAQDFTKSWMQWK